ncbi:MAG: hypothetical protein M1825_000803 [Sarcosagium campestre]|nr:MAG: hypothetical protein M1825_000803 [Sarcosagium campestre]
MRPRIVVLSILSLAIQGPLFCQAAAVARDLDSIVSTDKRSFLDDAADLFKDATGLDWKDNTPQARKGTETDSTARACNNYPEFCDRKYSNITEVCAHNSMFVGKGNPSANQELDVLTQLNDGVRMLQGQVHKEDDKLYFCHTSCALFNAGVIVDWLREVATWISEHPDDVVTILLGNSDNVPASDFQAPLEESGLAAFAYKPPKTPMALSDWPTLASMLDAKTRAVIFLDYKADQKAVPYLLDEFSQLWETPFSPTDATFPCTVQRPEKLSEPDARDRLYMANHNLNRKLDIFGQDIGVVPDTDSLEDTNAVDGPSSLGKAAEQCTSDHGRPPNFLLVDYYNVGDGSVFEVAAKYNKVTYTRSCCG